MQIFKVLYYLLSTSSLASPADDPCAAFCRRRTAVFPFTRCACSTIVSLSLSSLTVCYRIVDGISVMRRRADGWLNATQILKVAGFDKPQRTRVLEREVQKGLHEKVQGGYGKYQGLFRLPFSLPCRSMSPIPATYTRHSRYMGTPRIRKSDRNPV